MAEVVVNNLIERLLEFGRENVELIAGVQDDVNNLVADLHRLKAFLNDVLWINRNTEDWKRTMKEIRGVVYKAEDAIDKFLIEAKQHQDKNKATKWIDAPCWSNVRNVAKEIRSISNSVNQVRAQNQTLLDGSKMGTFSATAAQPREQALSDEDDVVGFEEEASTVISRLIGGSKNLEAVPIAGMPGLGKSTLARKVFKDSRINYEFLSCKWISVYRTYIKKDVLLKILASFTKRKNEHENMTEDQITDAIRNFIEKGWRCLIVLDDVWNGDVMNFVKHVFPKNNRGHRIITTTRQVDVASCFSEDIHHLRFLSDDDSFLLLKKKVFRKDSCPSEFEEPGINIAKKCNGVPFAVVVTAGALAGCKTRREWQLVDQNIGNLLTSRDNPDNNLGFVKLSYDLLSYYQKACFLYCATFPRGFDIPAWKLIRLWIAEGFVPSQRLILEEQAENCLNDLTKKSLVMVMKRRRDGRIKTCRIHDVLYEFCKQEASEEDIFQEIRKVHDQSLAIKDSDSCRRLCIDSSTLNDFLCSLSKTPTPMENIRSFLCFSSKPLDMPNPAVKAIPKGFPLIKVLDVEPTKFTFTKEFYRLFHLRYISFTADFNALPPAFGKFWNLETLIIHTTNQERTFEVKADIWSMMRLRHFHTNVPAKLPAPNASTSKERECHIQTLSTIAPQSCTKKVFARARYLKKLAIQGHLVTLLDNNTGGLSDVAELKQLENLKFVNDGSYNGKVITLPKLVFIFPRTLRKLTFVATQLEWSEMSKLGQLETLEVLKLKENAFKGEIWEPEVGHFSGLLVLLIERTDLKTWRASNHNFPNLIRLVLISCENLEAVPESLADIPNLLEMKLEHTKKAVKSARIIEQKKLQHRSSSGIGFTLSVFPPDSDVNSKSIR